jgi:hypothetical protein
MVDHKFMYRAHDQYSGTLIVKLVSFWINIPETDAGCGFYAQQECEKARKLQIADRRRDLTAGAF